MRPNVNHFTRPPRPPVVGDIGQQLRELPAEVSPPYDFAEFQQRGRERLAPSQRRVTWPHAAAAAGLTAVVAAMALLGTRGGSGRDEEAASSSPAAAAIAPRAAATGTAGTISTRGDGAPLVHDGAETSATGAGNNAPGGATAVGRTPALAATNVDYAASDQARAAREWLAHQPAEPALVRAGSRLTVTSLEDRIAWFDDALTDQRLHGADPTQLKVLQQERARLVSSLAQVRFAEALVANGS